MNEFQVSGMGRVFKRQLLIEKQFSGKQNYEKPEDRGGKDADHQSQRQISSGE
jgi:hypothetical protein